MCGGKDVEAQTGLGEQVAAAGEAEARMSSGIPGYEGYNGGKFLDEHVGFHGVVLTAGETDGVG